MMVGSVTRILLLTFLYLSHALYLIPSLSLARSLSPHVILFNGLMDAKVVTCALTLEEGETSLAKDDPKPTDPDGTFIRVRNYLNVSVDVWISITFQGLRFWPQDGSIRVIDPNTAAKADAAWSDGTSYTAHAQRHVSPYQYKERKFRYDGLDLYVEYDKESADGWRIIEAKRLDNSTDSSSSTEVGILHVRSTLLIPLSSRGEGTK